MSRVGKQPIQIPNSVDVRIAGQDIIVKGPKGELVCRIHPLVSVSQEEVDGAKVLSVSVKDETSKSERAQWGTARACLNNLVVGVTEGFSKKLEVNGVGYRVSASGNKLVLNVGYSHSVEFPLPVGIDAAVADNVITLTGANKELVGQVASEIRSIRKPEPYKGKGIKYVGEHIRRKAGKAAKAGE